MKFSTLLQAHTPIQLRCIEEAEQPQDDNVFKLIKKMYTDMWEILTFLGTQYES